METLGMDEGLRFIYRHGGKKFYFPNSYLGLPDSLAPEVPEQLFNRFSKVVDSSGYIEIPSPWGIFGAIRKFVIEEQFRQGMDTNTLQANFGITRKAIYNMKKRVAIYTDS